MTSKTKKLLALPVVLAVVVLAGCEDGSAPVADASVVAVDAAARDAGRDAGCSPDEMYDPVTMRCDPIA